MRTWELAWYWLSTKHRSLSASFVCWKKEEKKFNLKLNALLLPFCRRWLEMCSFVLVLAATDQFLRSYRSDTLCTDLKKLQSNSVICSCEYRCYLVDWDLYCVHTKFFNMMMMIFFTSVCDRAEQCKVTTTSIERETLTWHTNRGGQIWSSRVKFGAVEAHITPQFTLFPILLSCSFFSLSECLYHWWTTSIIAILSFRDLKFSFSCRIEFDTATSWAWKCKVEGLG